ncbi:MAG TPA: CvpA family protein [Steroidobacteraceae bacterium]|nr:CvpA family protein [Steroidobacteraceae bacterium]
MNGADYLIIAVLALSTLLGLVRGFFKESISLLAWLAGLWLAWRYAFFVEPHLGGLLAEEPVNTWVARLIVLVTVVFAGWIAAAGLSYLVRQSQLSLMMDRLLGVCFGLARGALIVAIAVIFGRLVELDDESWWSESLLMPYAAELSGWVRSFAEAGADYIEQLDRTAARAEA